MKKTLALLAATAAFVVSAPAATYTDVILGGLSYVKLTAGTASNSYSNTFDITDHGYNPASEQVYYSTVHFAFADDGDRASEQVTIQLDDWTSSAITVGGSIWSYQWVWGSLTGSLLATLSDTGLLDFTVTAVKGDTYLKEAKLVAKTKARPVPDTASTLALFGLGLLGLAAARKKLGRS